MGQRQKYCNLYIPEFNKSALNKIKWLHTRDSYAALVYKTDCYFTKLNLSFKEVKGKNKIDQQ